MFDIDEKLQDFPMIVAAGLLGYIWFQVSMRDPQIEYVPLTKDQIEWEYQNVPLFNRTVDSIVSRLRYALQQSNSADVKPRCDSCDWCFEHFYNYCKSCGKNLRR